jgi:hypothetical protein
MVMRYVPYEDRRDLSRASEMAGPPDIVQPEPGWTIWEKLGGAAIFLAMVVMLGGALYLIQPPSDRAHDVAAILTPDGE